MKEAVLAVGDGVLVQRLRRGAAVLLAAVDGALPLAVEAAGEGHDLPLVGLVALNAAHFAGVAVDARVAAARVLGVGRLVGDGGAAVARGALNVALPQAVGGARVRHGVAKVARIAGGGARVAPVDGAPGAILGGVGREPDDGRAAVFGCKGGGGGGG